MDFTYFDQNIWSNITRQQKTDKTKYLEFITRLKNRKDICVVYSKVNIKETLKRDYQDEIQMELSIISYITSNRLINENGEIREVKPYELFNSILIENEITKKLLKAIEPQRPKNIPIDPSIKRRQNNIEPEKAAKQVFNRFINQVNFSDKNVDFKQIDNIVNTLNNTIIAIFQEKAKKKGETDMADKYSKIVSSILKNSMDIGKQKAVEAMNKHNSDETIKTILSLNSNAGYKTSVIQGMLGAFQYWPDDNKLLKRKSTPVDMDDAAHSKYAPFCNLFVSNDDHLRTRINAAAAYLNSNTKFINYAQFLEYIEKEI